MKHFVLIIFLISVNTLYAQIINPDFENWEIISMFGEPYEDPVGWHTNNENDHYGFANTPVTKGIDSSGIHARIESNYRGIDALLPGELSQTISSDQLSRIVFDFKCDSIFQSGKCVVNLLGQNSEEVLYTDSISTETTEFQSASINILGDWVQQNDSLTIQFVAKGNLDMWDLEEDGYAIFLIDNVIAEYISKVNEPISNPSFKMYPNPTTGNLQFQMIKDFAPTKINILRFSGERIYSDQYSTSMDVSWVPDGLYIVRLLSSDKSINQNLLIRH